MNKATSYTLDDSIKLFKALADPVRLRIINLLDGGEVCVCHIHEVLGLPQSTVSRHLAYLKKHGLVTGRKESTWMYYRLAKPANALHRKISECLEACFHHLPALKNDKQKLARRSCCEYDLSCCE